MGQTLTHGIYLPDEGERNCYSGLAANWGILDGAVGTIAAHTAALAGKAPLVHTHTKSDITDFPAYGNAAGTICEGNDSRLSDARTPVAHTHTKSDVTDLLNSNFIPSANNSYDLGSSSYQWNNLYAKRYYYNGVAWGLDKYNWWSLAQFYAQNSIHVRNVEPGVAPTSNITAGFRVENANASYAFCDVLGAVNTSGTTYVYLQAANKFSNGALDPNGTAIGRSLQVGLRADGSGFIYTDCGWRNNLIPHAMEPNLSLGTSTNKWKYFNGVNPGALSLPNISGIDPIDFSQWDVSGAAWTNYYTPSANGWLRIAITDRATNSIYVFNLNDISASVYGNGSQTSGGANRLVLLMPVLSGVQYCIIIVANSIADVGKAEFIPCKGNV